MKCDHCRKPTTKLITYHQSAPYGLEWLLCEECHGKRQEILPRMRRVWPKFILKRVVRREYEPTKRILTRYQLLQQAKQLSKNVIKQNA